MPRLSRCRMLVGTAATALAMAIPFAAPSRATASAPLVGKQAPGFYRDKVGTSDYLSHR